MICLLVFLAIKFGHQASGHSFKAEQVVEDFSLSTS